MHGVLGEGFIDPGYHRLTQFIWNGLDKFRTGPRTTPTVSAVTGSRTFPGATCHGLLGTVKQETFQTFVDMRMLLELLAYPDYMKLSDLSSQTKQIQYLDVIVCSVGTIGLVYI